MIRADIEEKRRETELYNKENYKLFLDSHILVYNNNELILWLLLPAKSNQVKPKI